jgi:1-deoxy-D-xylulose-5-phosphate reductoisomerase
VGGLAPAALNAANEIAVAAFLEGRLNFCGIGRVIESVMGAGAAGTATDLDSVLAADAEARDRAIREVARLGRAGATG